jgi:Spy/CpxP family protein refolding chaperone
VKKISTAVLLAAFLIAPVTLLAQGGGRGGSASRMDLLTQSFSLTKDQQKQVKTILDTDFKSAAPLRDQLKKTREALGVVFEAKKPQADIDQAVKAYAAQVTAMTQAETKALAKVLQALTADQRGNQQATQSAVYMMRGAFAGKKWDAVPDVWFY